MARFLKSRAAAEPIKIELRIGGDILLEMLVMMDGSGESCKEVIAPLLLLFLIRTSRACDRWLSVFVLSMELTRRWR